MSTALRTLIAACSVAAALAVPVAAGADDAPVKRSFDDVRSTVVGNYPANVCVVPKAIVIHDAHDGYRGIGS